MQYFLSRNPDCFCALRKGLEIRLSKYYTFQENITLKMRNCLALNI